MPFSKIADQWFGIAYVQIAVAVLVAILGIMNAPTVSISDRRRELASAAGDWRCGGDADPAHDLEWKRSA